MSNETKNQTVNLSRRRLTKGGLAGSAVLASLASKNVLAYPYRCSVSGQISGNYSPVARRDGAEASCVLGPSVTTLKDGNEWGDVIRDAYFMDIFGITSPNYYVQDNKLTSSSDSDTNPNPKASLIQILTLEDFQNKLVTNRKLAEVAVAAFVGANTVDYPLTSAKVTEMFRFSIANEVYPYPSSLGTVMLDPTEVEKYFRFLFGDPTVSEPFLTKL